jgi:hypothetical protein
MRNTTGQIAILSGTPPILDVSMRPDLWRKKAVGFALGLSAALLLNLLVGPGAAVWRSSETPRPADPPSAPPPLARSVPAVARPAEAPAVLAAKPAPAAEIPASAPVSARPLEPAGAHKSARAAKRHPPKRRAASRH